MYCLVATSVGLTGSAQFGEDSDDIEEIVVEDNDTDLVYNVMEKVNKIL